MDENHGISLCKYMYDIFVKLLALTNLGFAGLYKPGYLIRLWEDASLGVPLMDIIFIILFLSFFFVAFNALYFPANDSQLAYSN